MKTSRSLVLLGIVMGLAPIIAQAVPVPAAGFYEEVSAYPIEKFGHSPGTLTIQESIERRGSAEGFAKTTGGLLPTASIDLHLTGYDPSGMNGRAIAETGYYWAIEEVAGTPYYA